MCENTTPYEGFGQSIVRNVKQPGIISALHIRKKALEEELDEIKKAIEITEKNPQISEFLEVLSGTSLQSKIRGLL